MGTLKDYLTRELKIRIFEDKEALKKLGKIDDYDNANYKINIRSAWIKSGEKSTSTKNYGSLKDSIRIAEQDFMNKNSREDIQGEYLVRILLGNQTLIVPKRYWQNYIKKSQTSQQDL